MSARTSLADSLRFVRRLWREKHPRKCFCGTPLADGASHCSEKCAYEQWEWNNS